ncbi:MAG TPA: hypothetical protein VGD22_10250, partial [Sphingobacteriaceae bacterium]
MKLTHLLLLLGFSYSTLQAGELSSWQQSKFTFDTIKTVTLEDKLKNKAQESTEIQNHINGLAFRERLSKSADVINVLPRSSTIKSGLTPEAAIISYDEILLSSRRIGDRKKESDALKAYGSFYALNGDFDKSIS